MKLSVSRQSPLASPDFVFGVATASFQIEGSILADGRVESIWDRFCATPDKVLNGDNGEPACEHYRLWQKDLDMVKSLNFDAYRFSIAWPRIESSPGKWNPKGLSFYDRLVDGMLERRLSPYATLYHWDLPQFHQDKNGWLNRDLTDRFCDYVDQVTRLLGTRIRAYSTLNEPWCSAYLGYRFGVHAPGMTSKKAGFQAAHHLLLAHGKALPIMRANAPQSDHGIVLNFTPAYPASGSDSDRRAAQYCDDENGHWFIKPIMEGAYPESVLTKNPDYLPDIQPGDLQTISTPVDYLGVNYYSRQVVRSDSGKDYVAVEQPDAEHTDIGWEIYPDGLKDLLVSMHQTYHLPPVYISENGAACADQPDLAGRVDDDQRCRYYQSHLNSLEEAMQAGVDVRGYFAWSLMDNFEWAEGYSKRFGLVYVDYQSQQRLVKDSGLMFRDFLEQRR